MPNNTSFFWTQNGHSNKARGVLNKASSYFLRMHSGHNEFDKIIYKPYLLILRGINMKAKILTLGMACIFIVSCASFPFMTSTW